MTTAPAPQLAPPGAGLPRPELFVARLRFAWVRRRGTRAGFDAQFAQERDRVLALAAGCSPEQAARRVLIARLRGMEDSSRHWSVWMTLDHLRITNNAFAGVITLLGQGKVPPHTASTAAVKPSPDVDAGVVEAFTRSCDDFLRAAAAVPDLRTAARYTHPWFGPLDAAAWHALGPFHVGLHRRQIERILAAA